MKRFSFIASLGAIAIAAASPGLADPGGGRGGGQGGGHGQSGMHGGGHGQGGIHGQGIPDTGGMSRGHAGDRGIDSGMGTSTIRSSNAPMGTEIRRHSSRDLAGAMGAHSRPTGIVTGMNLVDSSGATVGTVTGVTTRGNGTVRNVQVMLTDGRVITLRSQNLTLNNGVLATNTLLGQAANRRVNSQGPFHASPQGLIHASPNSVLAGAGVTTLTGLATGLTVNNLGGTAIGTVDSVLTNRSGAVVGINVDLLSGDTVFVPARTLTMNGVTVVTSSNQF